MSENQDSPEERTILLRDLKLHLIYLGFIVSLVFIWLVTSKVGANKEAVDYISFASTFASLLLAVVAIYIGLTGNSTLWSILGGARELFQKSLETLSFIRESGKTNAETAERLAAQVSQMASVLNERHISIEARLQRLQSTLGEQIPNITRQHSPPVGEFEMREAIFRIYISWTSNNGLMVAYIITRIAGTSVAYDRKRFGEILPSLGGDYAHGIIIASVASNVFPIKPGNFNEPYYFSKMPEQDIQVVEAEIQLRLNRDKVSTPEIASGNLQAFNVLKVLLDNDLQQTGRASFTL